MTTLPMQYFGRGSAHIIMPRAVARRARREWILSPSLIILILSLTLFTIHKLTLDQPLILKHPRTIIILPQEPSLPKPTVEEKLSFFKVVKDAAQKSFEPRKKELKSILEPPQPITKKTAPPPIAKPKKPDIATAKAPTPKILTPLAPKRVKTLPVNKKPLSPRVLSVPIQPKTPILEIKVNPPLPTAQHNPKIRDPQKRRELSLKTAPDLIPQLSVKPKLTTTRITPSAKSPIRLAPVDMATAPLLKKRRTTGPAATPAAPSKKSFSPLSSLDSGPIMAASKSMNGNRAGIMTSASPKDRPLPTLTQLSTPTSVAVAASPTRRETGAPDTGSNSNRQVLTPTPSTLTSPHLSNNEGGATIDINVLLQIQGSTLGQSLRVQNLKEEIYRKTRHMPAKNSPYIYRIHNYRCTVVISGGHLPTATLTFEPSDAPFEVVSALERLLPRRTM